MNQANWRGISYLLICFMKGSGIQQTTSNPALSAQPTRLTTILSEEPLGPGLQDCTLNIESQAHPPTTWTTPLQEVLLPLTVKMAGP